MREKYKNDTRIVQESNEVINQLYLFYYFTFAPLFLLIVFSIMVLEFSFKNVSSIFLYRFYESIWIIRPRIIWQ